eukprot:TRINITY_DN15517_c0_g1_i1.p1 TRINITY_DN15517_c0_g1~~TRINITY_DN15517_c0_g1_i1.p1  ORF type:complete len:653 (-),score=123.95 TRINITY_DN15517_c0_g1_i1:112-2070(-)
MPSDEQAQARLPARLRAEVARARLEENVADEGKFWTKPSVAAWLRSPSPLGSQPGGAPCDLAAKRCSRRVRFREERGDAEGCGGKYTDEDSLCEVLQKGHTKLLDAAWLIHWARGDDAEAAERRLGLPRCQDLPAEAFWRPEDKPWSAPIVCVSQCWAAEEHPDPDGQQTRQSIVPVLDKFAKLHGRTAVFIDYCSLPQAPRSVDEQARYEAALEDSPLWFAHSLTTVWLQMCVPDGSQPFSGHAWQWFTRSIGLLQFAESRVFDIGLLSAQDSRCCDYYDMELKCRVQAEPPVVPEAFSETLSCLRSHSDAERDVLARKYADVFGEMVASKERLICRRLRWGADALSQLAPSLSLCRRLSTLSLRDNLFVDISALGVWLPAASCLESLDLSKNRIKDVEPLSAGLQVSTTLRYLSFWGNQIDDITSLRHALAVNRSVTELHLDKNQICDVAPLAEALASNTSLLHLNLRSNRIVHVHVLGEALLRNVGLEELVLDDNAIVDVRPLCEALSSNCSLRTLRLKGNRLVDAEPFAAVLSKNQTLEALDLRGNPLVSSRHLLHDAWWASERLIQDLRGCELLAMLDVPPVKGCDALTYVDADGYSNTWWVVFEDTLSWISEDEESPSFEAAYFYPCGPDGLNYISTEEPDSRGQQ